MFISCSWVKSSLLLKVLIGMSCIVLVCFSILAVTSLGAAPPFDWSILSPKSPSNPAGLCDAVRRKQPSDFVLRIRFDAAGVQIIPFLQIMKSVCPNAIPIRIVRSRHSRFKYRPSPDMMIVPGLWNSSTAR